VTNRSVCCFATKAVDTGGHGRLENSSPGTSSFYPARRVHFVPHQSNITITALHCVSTEVGLEMLRKSSM
jgi:hypothetical protein